MAPCGHRPRHCRLRCLPIPPQRALWWAPAPAACAQGAAQSDAPGVQVSAGRQRPRGDGGRARAWLPRRRLLAAAVQRCCAACRQQLLPSAHCCHPAAATLPPPGCTCRAFPPCSRCPRPRAARCAPCSCARCAWKRCCPVAPRAVVGAIPIPPACTLHPHPLVACPTEQIFGPKYLDYSTIILRWV